MQECTVVVISVFASEVMASLCIVCGVETQGRECHSVNSAECAAGFELKYM